MKLTRPNLSLLYAKNLSSVLLLFTIMLTGLILYPSFELKSIVVKPAFGQAIPEAIPAATETTTAENTLAPPLTPTQEQQVEQQQEQSPSDSILLTSIELLELVDKAGDASQDSSYLKMSPGGGDEECCQTIQYTPGPLGVAGITFKDPEAFDLTNAKRVVFFAMGQKGGETMKFLAAGSTTSNTSLNGEGPSLIPPSSEGSVSLPADIFSDKKFGRITQDIVLEKNWNRYQISLDGLDLKEITDPFGFVISSSNNNNGSGTPISFNLKGVTYDTKPATDPVDTQQENATLSSSNSTGLSNSTSLPVPSNSTEAAISNSTSLPVPSNSTEAAISNSTSLPVPSNSTEAAISNSTSLPVPVPSNSTEAASSTLSPTSKDSSSKIISNSNTTGPISNRDLTGQDDIVDIIDDNSPSTDNTTVDQSLTQRSSDKANSTNSDTYPIASSSSPISDDNGISSPLSSSASSNFSVSNLTVPSAIESQTVATDLRTNSNVNTGSGTNNDQSLNENLNSTFLGPITSNNQQPSVLPNQPYASTINSSSVALPTPSLVPSEVPINQQFSLLPPEAFNPTFSDNTPPDTVIPLVTDSNTGLAIQNGGTSDSSSVLSVTFDGLDEIGNSIAGYQCSIDGTSNYCTSPITLDNNYLGNDGVGSTLSSTSTHVFQVSAVDAAGNVDPSPASFEWSVVNTNAQAQDANALGRNVQDTGAPDTQIMSVVDSNNAAVLNGSSVSISSSSAESPAAYQVGTSGSAANTTDSNTDANALTFSFAGTDDSNIISGYECTSYVSSSLPEQVDFVPCTNPFISQQLSVEPSEISTDSRTDTTHIFQVRATDTSGNVDPTPATFLWTITPDTGALEDVANAGIEAPSQQDPLLQQQLPQDPLLQQQLPQDPLLQQQLPQDPLLQQQLPQDPLLQQQLPQDPLLQQQLPQDPLLQQQLPQDPLLQQQQQQQQPGITIQGPFPGTEQFGQGPQQVAEGEILQVPAAQNSLAPPVILSGSTQDLTSLPSGTTVYGSSNNGDFGNDQSAFGVGTNAAHTTGLPAHE
jgi:hypothetical protein